MNQFLAVGSLSDSYLLVWIRAVNAVFFLIKDASGQFLPGDDSSLYSMEQIKTMQEENIALCRAIGEPASRELARVLMFRGQSNSREVDNYSLFFKESLALSQQNHFRWEEAECLLYWYFNDSGNFQKGMELLEASLEICRALGDPQLTAVCLGNLAFPLFYLGEFSRSRLLIAESLKIFRELGDFTSLSIFSIWQYVFFPEPENARQAENALDYIRDHRVANPVLYLCLFSDTEWSLGNYHRAESVAQEALDNSLKPEWSEEEINKFYPRLLLGRSIFSRGDLDKARQHFEGVVTSVQDEKNLPDWMWVEILDPIAVFLTAVGQVAQAAKVFGVLDEKPRYWAFAAFKRWISERDSALAAVRETLGEEAFAQAWQSGQAMTLWQAFEYVRSEPGLDRK